MARLILFYRLMVRPLLKEPVRAALTLLAVALGVAVVLAIDLAGNAATGSFRSSMETLAGASDLEVVASGGLPENILGTLATFPEPLQLFPRIEDFATLADSKQTLPLIGVDFIGESNALSANSSAVAQIGQSGEALKFLNDGASVWVGQSLGHKPGNTLRILINDQTRDYIVRGVYPDDNGNQSAIVMDIALAQRVAGKTGRLDRVLMSAADKSNLAELETRIRSALPAGIQIRPAGAATEENRKMLAAFRWNLKLLSYIALIVGAFLIYNTISVSVVRRRSEIGIVRAVGATRNMVLAAFLGEAAFFGITGALLGLPLGRIMAAGAVKLMGGTVTALYVSSRPGEIALSVWTVALALGVGIGISVASALSPAREAADVAPVEAMARGRREYEVRVHKTRDLIIAVILGIISTVASQAPAIDGKPLMGYAAALLLVAAASLAIPAFATGILKLTSPALRRFFGVEALLAARSLSGSLRRTAVLVAALATAIAMVTSVGIMVGSFRQTVFTWMQDRLPADFYLRPAGGDAADRHPTIALEFADHLSQLPGVAAVERLRAYEISYQGKPVALASVDLSGPRTLRKSDFFSGRPTEIVLDELRNANAVVVSEPFTYKHHAKAGDLITLSLGAQRGLFRIADIFYDYGSERGVILMDRATMLKYLPDPAPTNLAVYLAPGADPKNMRAEIEKAVAGRSILIFSNGDLRGEAIRIFDRTFAITYALEAIAVIVAVMGIAGALLALVFDRRRELGLLQFLGAAPGQLKKLILTEAGILGLLASAVGLALGCAMSLILIFVINKQSFGWTIRFHWPVAVLLGALSVVYSAMMLAGLYPARVAARLNAIEVVHEE